MINRMNYIAINGPAIQAFMAVKPKMASINAGLRGLVEVRVSQVNTCNHCIHVHGQEALRAGEPQARLDAVANWAEADVFTAPEKAAFAWAESVTKVGETGVPDDIYDAVRAHYSDQEVVDLTLIVALMNAWNRMAVSFRHEADV